MNLKSTVLATCLTLLLSLTGLQAQSVNDLYKEGKAAYDSGDWMTAIEKLGPVVQRTGDARATFMLKNARMRAAQPARSNLEAKLSQLTIKNLEFEDVDLGDAFEYLTAVSRELSEGQLVANIIYRGDQADLSNERVTLHLSNVPFTTVLKYVADLTGTEIKYEPYAIVASPRSEVEPPAEGDTSDLARLKGSDSSSF